MPLERMPACPYSNAYCLAKNSVAALGNPIGAEARAGVHRLFGRVEQQSPARTLDQHHPHCVLRHRIMAKEVELEALSQGPVVDFSDLPLPGSPGVGNQDIHPPIGLAHPIESGPDILPVGHVAARAQAQ